jgi:hypothetical protein
MDTSEDLSLLCRHTMSIHNFSKSNRLMFEPGQLGDKTQILAKAAIRDMDELLGLEKGALPKIKPLNPNVLLTRIGAE